MQIAFKLFEMIFARLEYSGLVFEPDNVGLRIALNIAIENDAFCLLLIDFRVQKVYFRRIFAFRNKSNCLILFSLFSTCNANHETYIECLKQFFC